MKKNNKKSYKVKAAFNDTEVGTYAVGDSAALTEEQAKKYKMFLHMPEDKNDEVPGESGSSSKVGDKKKETPSGGQNYN